MKKWLVIALAITLIGCTDAQLASVTSLGQKSYITCYSGGVAIHTDISTGKISSVHNGAGLIYESAETGKYVRTYADCIVIEAEE